MQNPRWHRVVGNLVYTLMYERALDDDLVEHRANALLVEPFHGFSQDEEYAAINETLMSGDELTGLPPTPQHGEEHLRDFLTRVRDRLDAKRPWPDLPFVTRDDSEWNAFTGGPVIARLHSDEGAVRSHLRRHFGPVEVAEGRRKVLILRLRSGDEVALITPWWRDNEEHIAVIQHPDSDRSANEVLTAFRDATGYGADAITDLTAGRSGMS
ncbi:MAG: hypothetical protein GEV10_21445 [Streptosporangiales bacterium]|nr:hypothetical protein [Streptosporangiales bacterium]